MTLRAESRDERPRKVKPCSVATGDILVTSKIAEASPNTAEEAKDPWTSVRLCSLLKLHLIHSQSANDNHRTACWASAGYATAGCAVVEQALRECMDGPKPPPKKKNNINYHLSRFKKYLEGNTKKK